MVIILQAQQKEGGESTDSGWVKLELRSVIISKDLVLGYQIKQEANDTKEMRGHLNRAREWKKITFNDKSRAQDNRKYVPLSPFLLSMKVCALQIICILHHHLANFNARSPGKEIYQFLRSPPLKLSRSAIQHETPANSGQTDSEPMNCCSIVAHGTCQITITNHLAIS